MFKVNRKTIFNRLKEEFINLDVKLEKKTKEKHKISIVNSSGATMYFYPDKLINFPKIYGVIPFETENQYIDYLINEIKEFYGNDAI